MDSTRSFTVGERNLAVNEFLLRGPDVPRYFLQRTDKFPLNGLTIIYPRDTPVR